MRRLFSTFARGIPGAGLLVLRIAGGASAITRGIRTLSTGPPVDAALPAALAIAAGALLLAGLWTPVSGAVLAFVGVWAIATSQSGLVFPDILSSPQFLLAAIGVALSLVGPGAWSADARLFGWRRIDVRNRTD